VPNKLKDFEKVEIVEKYKTGNYSCEDLGKEYGVQGQTVCSLLKRRGIARLPCHCGPNRKYPLNQNYFSIINTEDKAYFLGLMYADGCNNDLQHKISISLQEQDKEILEKFCKYLETDRPLYYFVNKPEKSKNNAYKLNIASKKLCSDLSKLGCVPRKSLILKFPTNDQVPDYLIRHFMRGYFDGDGCITSNFTEWSIKNYVNLKCSFLSTKEFCEAYQKKLYELLKVECVLTRIKSNDSSHTLTLSGKKNSLIFASWLYDDCSVFLKRKRDKYLSIREELFKRNLLREQNYDSKECSK